MFLIILQGGPFSASERLSSSTIPGTNLYNIDGRLIRSDHIPPCHSRVKTIQEEMIFFEVPALRWELLTIVL